MRVLETAFLAFVVASFLNSFFLRQKRLTLVLPVIALVLAVANALIGGFRIHIVPAYIIAAILLLFDVRRKLLPERRVHKVAKIVSLILLIPITLLAVTIPLLLFPVASMPAPSGEYAVGTRYLSFEDSARKEKFSASGEYRNLPVQIWYPAVDDSKEEYASWISHPEAMKYFTSYRGLPNIAGHLSLVKTNSHLNADVSVGGEPYPVLLFSGGGAMFHGQNVIQMEELASHGYVVFAVGHPYEDFAALYPDGSVVAYSEELKDRLGADQKQGIEAAKQSGMDESSEEFIRVMLRNMPVNWDSVELWADDFSFLLDQVEKMNDGKETSPFAGKLDMDSIGAFGHSFGGAAAGQACLQDSRIKAFVNMDGSPIGDAPDAIIRQPFMVLTAGENSRVPDGYSAQQRNYIEVTVSSSAHMNFSDLNTLIPALGKLTGLLGSIPEQRQNEITNAYLLAFFDKEVKGQESTVIPMFDGVTVETR